MKNDSSKFNTSWEELFSRNDILKKVKQSGSFIIEKEHFKQLPDKRQIRLLTKIDNSNQLPIVFKKNNLAILPLSRSKWIICNFEAFQYLEDDDDDFVGVPIPPNIESIDFSNITSESIAINVAYICGIIEDFVEEKLVPTIDGRMGSGTFEFKLKPKGKGKGKVTNVKVNGAQIEIDAGYEGDNSFVIFEVKMNYTNDFLIRQLYYPLKRWSGKVSKPIRTIFLSYFDSVFDLYEYSFDDENDYNSLRLIKKKTYFLITEHSYDIKREIGLIKVEPEPNVPFPQADNFFTIIKLLSDMDKYGSVDTEYIMNKYNFTDRRQVNYYISACKYIGLVESFKDGSLIYRLNNDGKNIIKKSRLEFKIELIKHLLKRQVFNQIYYQWILKSKFPSKEEIIAILSDKTFSKSSEMSDNTKFRRANTVYRWSKWIEFFIEQSSSSAD
jgi:hypothetical protein